MSVDIQQRVTLGDAHNFGRHVTRDATHVHKPRSLLWEWLLLSARSPLRVLLDQLAEVDALGGSESERAFAFLPDLDFRGWDRPEGGAVAQIALEPLPRVLPDGGLALGRLLGRALALFSWLGLSDLHWENLALGHAADGNIIFAPLDVEMVLADLARPTETKLLPEADPEVAALCQHACGVRRVLPYLGKPLAPEHVVSMAATYLATLVFLDRRAPEIGSVLNDVPRLRESPIRVLLRGTDAYVRARSEPVWPPLLEAEQEQLARGDIPYFFRIYGERGIRFFTNESLTETGRLPVRGNVPLADALLPLASGRALRSPSRKKLREEGLFTLLGAFDHPSFSGSFEAEGLRVKFGRKGLVVAQGKRSELETDRNLRAFVSSVYLPCTCGEVLTVLVPSVTTCSRARLA